MKNNIKEFIKRNFEKGYTLELEDLIHNLDNKQCYFTENNKNYLLKLLLKDSIYKTETDNKSYISIIYNNGNIAILNVA